MFWINISDIVVVNHSEADLIDSVSWIWL